MFIFKGNKYKHCKCLRETKGVNISSLIMKLKMNNKKACLKFLRVKNLPLTIKEKSLVKIF